MPDNTPSCYPVMNISGQLVPYQIVKTRRNRKNIVLRVKDNILRVSAPVGVSNRRIQNAIVAQTAWILESLSRSTDKALDLIASPGDKVLYRGDQYLLTMRRRAQVNPKTWPLEMNVIRDETEKTITVTVMEDAHINYTAEPTRDSSIAYHKTLQSWYQCEAKHIIFERMNDLSATFGVFPTKIVIGSQTTRWGSCSGLGTISINWRLIKAPPVVLDYVITHELAHLVEMNHSDRFWNLVRRWMPDYVGMRTWLKINGNSLFQSP